MTWATAAAASDGEYQGFAALTAHLPVHSFALQQVGVLARAAARAHPPQSRHLKRLQGCGLSCHGHNGRGLVL